MICTVPIFVRPILSVLDFFGEPPATMVAIRASDVIFHVLASVEANNTLRCLTKINFVLFFTSPNTKNAVTMPH